MLERFVRNVNMIRLDCPSLIHVVEWRRGQRQRRRGELSELIPLWLRIIPGAPRGELSS